MCDKMNLFEYLDISPSKREKNELMIIIIIIINMTRDTKKIIICTALIVLFLPLMHVFSETLLTCSSLPKSDKMFIIFPVEKINGKSKVNITKICKMKDLTHEKARRVT